MPYVDFNHLPHYAKFMTNLFLRHAEVLNKKNIQYANLPGFQISDQGKEQSVAAGKLLKNSNKKIEKIITSPLLRARETSSIVSEILKIPIFFSNNLTEWTGIKEKLKSVYERVDIEYKNNVNTLFVSHQDTIRAFTYFFTNDENFSMYRPKNCEIQFIDNNIVRTLT
jgi:broad specificity phosphatase PhoE